MSKFLNTLTRRTPCSVAKRRLGDPRSKTRRSFAPSSILFSYLFGELSVFGCSRGTRDINLAETRRRAAVNLRQEIVERDESRLSYFSVVVAPELPSCHVDLVPLSQIIAARVITTGYRHPRLPYDLSFVGTLASSNMKSYFCSLANVPTIPKTFTPCYGHGSFEVEREVHWGKLMRLSNYDRFV